MTASTQTLVRRQSPRRRRLVVLAAAVAALAMLAAACGEDEDASAASDCEPGVGDGDLVFYNWVDYMDEDLLTKFTAETGINVQYTTYESNEEMLEKVEEEAAIYDLVVPSDYMLATMRFDDLLLELNYDAIPNAANIGDEFQNPPFDPEHKYHVAFQWGTTGIGMTYDVLEELGGESTWAVIFDPEVAALAPGGISMLDDAPETVSAALKYLGYSIADVFSGEYEDSEGAIREAGDLLRATNARLVKYDSATYGDDLVNGEVDVSHGWSGGFALSIDNADAYDTHVYTIPKEGAVRWVDTMAIPHNANNVCSAHAMINFLTDAQNGAQLTNWTFYGSPNAAATPFVDAEILGDPGIYPPPEVTERLELIPQAGERQVLIQDQHSRAKS
ncbi:MAG: spermidine/putrescine ABC transporter substrate-binding protein [Acidimicrobiaceae bacterium]|nr:spermidine/putrescine ABC transporter substrate-binding protein [Acidimicrobiaceae bacterium]MCY4176263.1 spermidine/putrescine ABC transporter substrate-binding protein [Acidimicrobiaceae bacterium]MCY4280241.1 spermidine/putrescine ABC transporter substrate-binding protein [Acidimicrobiaceae bacterium]MCY4293577.1 spermidine/putrescine ABC transporter substrate-binding protein [Acidimicrobiaceae bacterium]